MSWTVVILLLRSSIVCFVSPSILFISFIHDCSFFFFILSYAFLTICAIVSWGSLNMVTKVSIFTTLTWSTFRHIPHWVCCGFGFSASESCGNVWGIWLGLALCLPTYLNPVWVVIFDEQSSSSEAGLLICGNRHWWTYLKGRAFCLAPKSPDI